MRSHVGQALDYSQKVASDKVAVTHAEDRLNTGSCSRPLGLTKPNMSSIFEFRSGGAFNTAVTPGSWQVGHGFIF